MNKKYDENLEYCDVYKLFHRFMYPKEVNGFYASLVIRGLKFWRKLIPSWFPQDRVTINLDGNIVDVLENTPIKHLYARRISYFISTGNEEDLSALLKSWVDSNERTCKDIFNVTTSETDLLQSIWWKLSCEVVAIAYAKIRDKYCEETSEDGSCDYQFHDFSMRGLWGKEVSNEVGDIWLKHHNGSDNLPALRRKHPNKEDFERQIVPATEHSISMCYGDGDGEYRYFEEIIFKRYPEGIVSIVADTYDFDNFIDVIVPSFKERILQRNGKVVIRGDSGNPVEVSLNAIQILDKHFGHTINSKGYKVLNEKIGFIYGDGISLLVADEILNKLKGLGYASSNIVLGVGAYAFNVMTRDTLGLAYKLNAKFVDEEWVPVEKRPKADPEKKSIAGIPETYIDENNCLRLKK